MSEQLSAIHATVRGRVQGVGFREFVETRARFLRLAGYVRNLPDGRSLEVVAEGPRETLEQLIDYLHEGPSMSLVNDVDVQWSAPTGGFHNFGTAF